MADQPIDVSDRPSMVSVQCGGTTCSQWIVVDRAYTGTGYCSDCLHDLVGGSSKVLRYDKPAHWFRANNPGPPPAVYPPSPREAYSIRVLDPDLSAQCTNHPVGDPPGGPDDPGTLALYSLDPADVFLAFAGHDHTIHNPDAWLIGGPGGADGDICNPCGGGSKDKTPLTDGPRHDLCLRGNPRGGWGRNCPCTHDKPYMRGIKPGHLDTPGAVERTRALIEANRRAVEEQRAAEAATPLYITDYLFDPEEDPDRD